jgi:hypothetical protein
MNNKSLTAIRTMRMIRVYDECKNYGLGLLYDHAAESSESITKSNEKRRCPLALQIQRSLPTMCGAFTELVNRVDR